MFQSVCSKALLQLICNNKTHKNSQATKKDDIFLYYYIIPQNKVYRVTFIKNIFKRGEIFIQNLTSGIKIVIN